MLKKITGHSKAYEWGSKDLLPDYFSLPKSNEKIAEVWFGTHPAGPALAGDKTLAELVGSELSFLAKFLSAASPLSIQVHPSRGQALEGFEREENAGISISDPKRNYKDKSSKPEILIALTEFEALCGFREIAELKMLFDELSEVDELFSVLSQEIGQQNGLRTCFAKLLGARELASTFSEKVDGNSFSEATSQSVNLAKFLLGIYPGDTGALVALMLNQVSLSKGEAIFLPAGNLHAYLRGLGVEVMKASDNVVRGGLTSKNVDVEELLKIGDFSALSSPKVLPRKIAEGLIEYQVDESSFRVYKAELSGSVVLADLDLAGNLIAICTAGEVAISTSLEEREVLRKSEAAFVSTAKKFSLAGSGEVFLVFGS